MDSDVNEYGFILYRMYDVKRIASDVFCSVDNYNRVSTAVINVYRAIIQKEQPISFDNLCKRLAPIYDYGMIGNKLKTCVKKTLRNYLSSEVYTFMDDDTEFVCMRNLENITVRYRTEDGYHQRDIVHICYEELMQALKNVLLRKRRLNEEELLRTTARALGFLKLGYMIELRLSNALEQMIRLNEAINCLGTISINTSSSAMSYRIGDYKRKINPNNVSEICKSHLPKTSAHEYLSPVRIINSEPKIKQVNADVVYPQRLTKKADNINHRIEHNNVLAIRKHLPPIPQHREDLFKTQKETNPSRVNCYSVQKLLPPIPKTSTHLAGSQMGKTIKPSKGLHIDYGNALVYALFVAIATFIIWIVIGTMIVD